MLKFVLVLVLFALLFGGGGARLRELVQASRRLKRDFKDGRDRAADPAGTARAVDGRVVERDTRRG
jgi:hypothetical protein